jgi:serine/threonine protein phosphatase PrpC
LGVTGELALRCLACDATLMAEDRYCEVCGTEVVAALPPSGPPTGACRVCGAPPEAKGTDGYCTVCGVRERVAAPRVELDLVVAAAVSEQGRSHRRNEDAFHLERVGDDGLVAVVCDGISTAASGDAAARAAATAAAAALARALRNGDDLEGATGGAVLAAQDAVQRVPATTRDALALPSCTLVSAACRDGELVIGWVGDSRAYWLAPGDARQLTVDDSWAAEQVADGLLSSEEAFADRRAHAITRWVGADSPPNAPQVTNLAPSSAGRLVLCTDGLWNSAPTAGELVELLAGLDADAEPASVAHHLADAAMARGARDDVTVAVIDIQPPGGRQP